MSLKSLAKSSRSIPVALAFLVVGLLILACGIEWRPVFSPALHLSPEMDDFARGFCIGLALTLEISALLLLVMHLQSREKEL